MSYIRDAALDAALANVRSNIAKLYICSALPSTYAEATGEGVGEFGLGNKDAPPVGAIGDRGGGGREFQVNAITDGNATKDGTASHIALVTADALLAARALSATKSVNNGDTFTLTAFKLGIPDA